MSEIESAIGKSPPRLEAGEKAGGTALFTTPCAGRHVRRRVRLSAAFAWRFA